jgi:hypothetical protein
MENAIKKKNDGNSFTCKTLYAIAKTSIRKLFIYPHLSESHEVKMSGEFLLKGCICELTSDIIPKRKDIRTQVRKATFCLAAFKTMEVTIKW